MGEGVQLVDSAEEIAKEVGEPRFSLATRHIPNEEFFDDVLDWQV